MNSVSGPRPLRGPSLWRGATSGPQLQLSRSLTEEALGTRPSARLCAQQGDTELGSERSWARLWEEDSGRELCPCPWGDAGDPLQAS